MPTINLQSDIPDEEGLIDQKSRFNELRDRLDTLYAEMTDVVNESMADHDGYSIAQTVIDAIWPYCSDEITREHP